MEATDDLHMSWDGVLCLHCRRVIDTLAEDAPKLSASERHEGDNIAKARERAHVGCKLCSFILSWLEADSDAIAVALLNDQDIPLSYRLVGSLGRWTLHIHVPNEIAKSHASNEVDPEGIRLFGVTIYACGDVSQRQSHAVTTYKTNSDETTARILAWIKACHGHPECQRWRRSCSDTDSFLPARLLHVSHEGADVVVKLVLKQDIEPGSKYAALSHCWGSTAMLRLTRDKLAAYQRSIPLVDLPVTFLQAAELILKLHIDYIWIDALCIIQDDARLEDWEQHVRIMGEIYVHAELCIAATASACNTEGIYRTRNPRLLQSIITRESSTSTDGYLIYTEDQIVKLKSEPLLMRSWVMQERFLATRTAHFATNQVFWECHQGATSESFELGASLMLELDFVRARFIREQDAANSAYKGYTTWTWQEIAAYYAGTQLSYTTDRPVAIAAVSRAYRRIVFPYWDECEYIYGLWKPWLLHQLVWFAYHKDEYSASMEGRVAESHCRTSNVPSWSWLSLNGSGLAWPDNHSDGKVLTELVGFSDLHEPDSEVPLLQAVLTLRAQLCQVQIIHAPVDGSADTSRLQASDFLFQTPWVLQFRCGRRIRPATMKIDQADDLASLRTRSEQDANFYLMFCSVTPSIYFAGPSCYNMLMLNLLDSGHFRRLGMVSWHPGTYKSRTVQGKIEQKSIKRLFKTNSVDEDAAGLPNDKHQYTIRII